MKVPEVSDAACIESVPLVPVVLISEADGWSFKLSRAGKGEVRIDLCHRDDLKAHFVFDPHVVTAETTIDVRLAVSRIGHVDAMRRKLDVLKVLAESRRLIAVATHSASVSSHEDAATSILESPEMRTHIREDLLQFGFGADPNVGETLYLCKISALLGAPVYVYLTGPPSSLKTWYADKLAELTAPELLKHLTDLTPKALYYGSPDLSHRVIVLDEMDVKARGLATDLKMLRMMHTKGWCEIEAPNGRTSARRRVTGPVAVVQTTVATSFDVQDQSRHLVIELEDSPRRAESALTAMAEQFAGRGDSQQVRQIAETHQCIHRLLPAGAEIVVPFAPVLADRMPMDSMVVLRTFRTLISLVKASALLHVRQRDVDDDGRIVAILDDYRWVYDVARGLLCQLMATTYIPGPARKWLEKVLRAKAQIRTLGEYEEWVASGDTSFLDNGRRWDEPTAIAGLVDLTETPRTTVQRYLEQLTSVGVVERQKAGRAFKYCLSDPCGELPTCPQLPAPDSVLAEHVGTSVSCGASDAEDDDWGRSSHEPQDSVANEDAGTPITFNSMDPDDLDRNDWMPESAVISERADADPALGRVSTGNAGSIEPGDNKQMPEPSARNLTAATVDLKGVGDEGATTADPCEA